MYEYACQQAEDAEDMLKMLRELLTEEKDSGTRGLQLVSEQFDKLTKKAREAAEEAKTFRDLQKRGMESLLGGPSKPKAAANNGGEWHDPVLRPGALSGSGLDKEEDEMDVEEVEGEMQQVRAPLASQATFADRARFIPLRLSAEERPLLRLLEACLSVSEYTDKVDVLSGFGSRKTQRITTQIKAICQILSGLLVASNYKKGQELITDKNFEANAEFFQVSQWHTLTSRAPPASPLKQATNPKP